MKNTRKGFTLVELLVVIAILAILATVSIVGYTSFINNANNSVAQQELTQIRDYYIAGKYLVPPTVVSDELIDELGLEGELTPGKVDNDTWYRYTVKTGAAYWNEKTGQITTDEPGGWVADDQPRNPLKGLKVSIMGDSISTYENYIKEGYQTYYPKYDVTDVSQTWWKQLIDNNGMELGQNASYSGTRVQNNPGSHVISSCEDERIELLGANGDPDIILILMGTNDINDEDLALLGKVDQNNEDTTTFLGAYQVMIKKMQSKYPNAKIVCLSLLWRKVGSISGYPQTVTEGDINVAAERISDICDIYGCEFIDMRQCGINSDTLDTHTIDGLHPNAKGHEVMASYIEKMLLSIYGTDDTANQTTH